MNLQVLLNLFEFFSLGSPYHCRSSNSKKMSNFRSRVTHVPAARPPRLAALHGRRASSLACLCMKLPYAQLFYPPSSFRKGGSPPLMSRYFKSARPKSFRSAKTTGVSQTSALCPDRVSLNFADAPRVEEPVAKTLQSTEGSPIILTGKGKE